jgi:DNA-binding IclR family transcriptional regulator
MKGNESPSTGVNRALAILDNVSSRQGGMTNSEISRKLKIPKSSASYILRALEDGGYLRRDVESGKYKLGLKLLSLRHSALAELDIREIAIPVMRQLVESSGRTAHLAILDRGEAVYIERVEAPGFIKMDTWIGRRMDLHSTGVGKALLAFQSPEDVEALIGKRGLSKHTARTITVPAKLLKELERARDLGYAIDDEENSLGVCCAAAPIFDANGRVEASVGLTGTVSTMDKSSQQRVVELVKDAARRISIQLGFRPAFRHRSTGIL